MRKRTFQILPPLTTQNPCNELSTSYHQVLHPSGCRLTRDLAKARPAEGARS